MTANVSKGSIQVHIQDGEEVQKGPEVLRSRASYTKGGRDSARKAHETCKTHRRLPDRPNEIGCGYLDRVCPSVSHQHQRIAHTAH